VINNVWKLWIT